MKILFISSGSRVPSARFRILPYLDHFRADGHSCVLASSFPQKYDYFPWMGFRPSQFLKRGVRWWHWLLTRIRHFDVVVMDREVFDNETLHMERMFQASCRRLVVDIDDAVFLRHPQKFEQLMQMADLVVCGNRFLMDKVEPLNSHRLHIPTCVDMNAYSARSPLAENPVPVVGWMGTTGNLKYLQVAAPALRQVAQEHSFELRIVVPDAQPLLDINLSGVNVVHERWDPANEVCQLQRMDIGLMPLFPDQEWDVYKCGLKLIQYLAVGIPGIAAPVGVNSEIIDENRNGFVAQQTEEWVAALRTLLQNPELRKQMGERGRETVAQKYSIQANYPVLRDRLLQLTRSI